MSRCPLLSPFLLLVGSAWCSISMLLRLLTAFSGPFLGEAMTFGSIFLLPLTPSCRGLLMGDFLSLNACTPLLSPESPAPCEPAAVSSAFSLATSTCCTNALRSRFNCLAGVSDDLRFKCLAGDSADLRFNCLAGDSADLRGFLAAARIFCTMLSPLDGCGAEWGWGTTVSTVGLRCSLDWCLGGRLLGGPGLVSPCLSKPCFDCLLIVETASSLSKTRCRPEFACSGGTHGCRSGSLQDNTGPFLSVSAL